MKPFLRASLICGTALLFGSSAFAQVATPAAQGSNSPAAGGPAGCTESLILPVGTYSPGPSTDPSSPGGWAAVPYSAVEEFWVLRVLTDGTVASSKRQSTSKIYQDSHGRRRRERPLCSQLYENAKAVLVLIDDPVAGYEYDLDPQNRIAYCYSLKALKDSVPAAHGNRSGPHMEVTKEPLGSQWMEGLLVVGTREKRRVIPAPAPDIGDLKTKAGIVAAKARLEVTKAEIEEKRKALEASYSEGLTSKEDYSRQRRELDERMHTAMLESYRVWYAENHAVIGRNDRPFTIVVEVWYSPEIKAVVLEKSIYAGFEWRLTRIDRAEPGISLFQPPADYKIEDATGPVTINYTNLEVPLGGHTQAPPEATGKPQSKTAPGSKPGEVRENPRDGLKYVWIPPGSFTMGCSSGDNECIIEEKPAHGVTISKGFWLGQTPVTVAAYRRYSGATGKDMPAAPDFNSGWSAHEMPIVDVSWDDAVGFCTWAGGRLPSEAEWEYAARAGSSEPHYGPIDEIAWYADNSGRERLDSTQIWRDDWKNYPQRLKDNGNGTHDVGRKRPNAFKLYDMLGNVWEWVNDWYGQNYSPASPEPDPRGPESGQYRVTRGGSWVDGPWIVRVSVRGRGNPGDRVDNDGFRCVGEDNIP